MSWSFKATGELGAVIAALKAKEYNDEQWRQAKELVLTDLGNHRSYNENGVSVDMWGHSGTDGGRGSFKIEVNNINILLPPVVNPLLVVEETAPVEPAVAGESNDTAKKKPTPVG